MKIRDLVRSASLPRRLLRFFCYKFPCTIKNFVVGFLKAKLKRHQCNICGYRKVEFVYATWVHYFLRCPQCNIYFVLNLPNAEKLCQEYIVSNDKEYLQERGEYAMPNWNSWMDWKIQTFKRLKLEEFEKEKGSLRRALEIGCAEGKVLEILKERGWNVIGLDVSEYEARLCKKLGFNVIVTTADKINFRDESFDLVVMFHTLEHTTNPMLVVRNVFNTLKKGGRLVFEVPYFVDKKILFEDFSNPGHLYFFSEKGLEKMLRSNGFTYLDKFIYEDQIHKPRCNICYLVEKR